MAVLDHVVILVGMPFLPGLFSRLPEVIPPLQAPGTDGCRTSPSYHNRAFAALPKTKCALWRDTPIAGNFSEVA
jgi:hypothetical protein